MNTGSVISSPVKGVERIPSLVEARKKCSYLYGVLRR
jgi:hypothetical protein